MLRLPAILLLCLLSLACHSPRSLEFKIIDSQTNSPLEHVQVIHRQRFSNVLISQRPPDRRLEDSDSQGRVNTGLLSRDFVHCFDFRLAGYFDAYGDLGPRQDRVGVLSPVLPTAESQFMTEFPADRPVVIRMKKNPQPSAGPAVPEHFK